MIAKDKIEELALECISEYDKNLFIVAISTSGSNQIRVELDKMGDYVNIEDCVAVSRHIEHNLDRDKEDFEIEVSSAGMTQPFRVHQQYVKNIGKEVKILLAEGNKSLEGELTHVDDEKIILKTTSNEKIEGKKKKEIVIREHELQFNEIKETKIIISFKK